MKYLNSAAKALKAYDGSCALIFLTASVRVFWSVRRGSTIDLCIRAMRPDVSLVMYW